MLINKTDIKEFGARLLTAEITPPQTTVAVEWLPGAVTPEEAETTTDFSRLKLTLYFAGKARDDVVLEISNMNALLQKAADLTIDGYSRKFRAFLTGNGEEKTIQKNRYTATFEFDGYWYGQEVALRVDGQNVVEFEAKGNRPAPAKITVIPNEDVEELTIYGFNEDMILRDLPRGATIIIDGELGIVTQDGASKFKDFEAWDWPKVTVGEKKAHTIHITGGEKCAITISYSPMYL